MSYNLNYKISDIWNRFSLKFTDLDGKNCMDRVPIYYLKPTPHKILFIGLNPAYQDNKKNINFSLKILEVLIILQFIFFCLQKSIK